MSLSRVLRRWAPLLAAIIVLVVYVQIIGAPFVWDDRHVIVESPTVNVLQPIQAYFARAFWTSPEAGDVRGYYRPLTVLSFALDYHLHGPNPAPFHLTNLALHVLNVVVLYFVMRRFRVAPPVAFALDLLWGLQPRLTEAAAWIAGRTDVLATTFVLFALLVHRPGRGGRMVVASCAIFLGLLAKEVAVAGAVALVALELTAGSRRRVRLAFLPMIAFAAYFGLRAHTLYGASATTLPDRGVGNHIALVLAAIGRYAWMVIVPWKPELQIDVVSDPPVWTIIVGLFALAVLGALAYRHRHVWRVPRVNVRPLVVGGSALAVAGIGLVLHVVPISINVVAADRFLYLPLAGLSLAIAPCVQAWTRGRRRWLAVPGVLAVSFAAATYVRAGDWCSEVRLWSKAYEETTRRNGTPAIELGNVYYRAGLFDEAAAIYATAAREAVPPDVARANYEDALSQLGDYEPAERELRALCDQHQEQAQFCVAAGLVALHRLRFEAARAWIRLGVERVGNYPKATAAMDAIARTEERASRPDNESLDPLVRKQARFAVAQLAGRRPDALRFGAELLMMPAAPNATRREAAEYWTRFGPPDQLEAVLGQAGASDVVDGVLRAAAAQRVATAAELRAAWPALNVPALAR